jgi:ribosome-associated toxin RatA of RatAB toxin-antitoxin module
MNRVKFSETIIICSSAEQAFNYSQDYANRLKWDTFLKKADLIEGATEAGLGVKAHCIAKNGLGMVTEYVSFNPPKGTAIKMTSGPWMFKSFLGSWNFRQLDPQTTEVAFLYSFNLRFPFNIATRLIKNNLRSNVKQRLKDLKYNIEKFTQT